MIETHPFGDYIPKNARYLLLGSFTTKPQNDYVWFYANGRNHFWPIMEEVYNRKLSRKKQQQKLFADLGMALADIIYSCERRNNSNLDNNLTNIIYNIAGVNNIVRNNQIKKIYFSSRFVEMKFKQLFKEVMDQYPQIDLLYLPSPSPRYAAMSRQAKITTYMKLLPKIKDIRN